MCFTFTQCACNQRANRQNIIVHCLASVISAGKKWVLMDTLIHQESWNCEHLFAHHSAWPPVYCVTVCHIPIMLDDPLSLLTLLPSQPFPPKSSKAALVSVKGKAWRLVSFEPSYVNACSHICLAVLDISTRKWNESEANVLASVELFSAQQLANSSSVFAFPETPWDGVSPHFRTEGEQFSSLIEQKRGGKKTKEMSNRVA